MDRKYLRKSTFKVAKITRLIAKAIDLFIVLILSIFFYPLGLILSGVYIAISDSLQGGQSVGKKFMGFAVISLEDGKPCSVRQSVIRNLPLLVPLALAIVPIWGWVLSAIIGIPLIVIELYFLIKLDSGHRLGDVMADTSVMSSDDSKAQVKNIQSSWFDGSRTN